MEVYRSVRRHQRVEWKFIKDRKRLLAFTKRRDEIFKEASELCTTLGVSIVVLITSLCGKIYSFAHPNVDSVESQFFNHTLLPPGILEPYREVHIKKLNKQLDDVRDKLEAEEKRAKVLKEMRDKRLKKVWEEPLRELSHDEALKVKKHLNKLQDSIFNIFHQKFIRDVVGTRMEHI